MCSKYIIAYYQLFTMIRGVHGGRPTEYARDKPPPGSETAVGLPGEQELYVRRNDLNHIMTSCTHFVERSSLDDIAEMKDGYVR